MCFLVFCLAPSPIAFWQQQAEIDTAQHNASMLVYREQGPIQQSILYSDGQVLDLQTESITWPILENETIDMTIDQFKDIMKNAKNNFDTDPKKVIISSGDSRGLDIQFIVSSPPSGAQTAINAVAAYIESLFTDPITVVITLGFQSMSPGVLGGTTCAYAGSVTWTNTRTGLITGMDADDMIQTYLPSTSTIPVRYNGDSATITNEDRCYFTKANYRATIGSVTGYAADMTINSDFSWDYDPSNGISSGQFCFQSVLAHEVGHVLGFTSGADFRYILKDIETLDVYRFQFSDGAANYNPETYTQFLTTPRLVCKNAPGTSDDVISDVITVEYRMSDGDPYQCSHFSQGNVYALMQPAISMGLTYYPHFYKTPDITMVDAIGWDYIKPPDTTPPVTTCVLSGTAGQNGWYLSSVTVTLTATDPPEDRNIGDGGLKEPSGVNNTYYKVDSGSFTKYTTPFVISAEGIHTVVYYSDDYAGNVETPKSVSIKIDKTKPSLSFTKEQIDYFTVKFMVDATDTMSGMDRVEFALDGSVRFSDTQPPYEWTWMGIGDHTVTITAYDTAGNAQSQSTNSPVVFRQTMTLVQWPFLQRLLQRNLINSFWT
ncbi:MAG: hypothetical protein BV459_03415 [Thermoplasmata archaeon M11B2D]|nr:MAG: hypothetical protein BV459_03415 [Thermoplasmata archaeon M11B2D]PNX51743.1 MAG: hypothetical protein BV458_11125 [Thermoplasmata archaeon M9B2D]